MRIAAVLLTLALSGVAGCGPPPPRLVVVISVDQMRADYLERFGPQFTGALARLLRDGAVYTDAHQDHGRTVTSPGHATISTGTLPARNGIVGNEWFDRREGRRVYSVYDPDADIVGYPADSGRSPRRLLRSALGDWLKAASPESKVFSVALKDRAAILMGGHRPDGAYWYLRRNGAIVTSTHYRTDYPPWATGFTAAHPVAGYWGAQWERLLGPEAYAASREDAFAAEGQGVATTFPHRVATGDSAPTSWFFRYTFPRTPLADQHMLAFARELVVAEELGADEHPDILFFGCSAADFIGHVYGPHSQEVQDYYLRLDRYLADFFALLDERIGPSRYLVVLTADHGVVPLPEELGRRNRAAGRVGGRDLLAAARDAARRVAQAMGVDPPAEVRRFWLDLLFAFADSLAAPERAEFHRGVAEALRRRPEIADAFTLEDLTSETAESRGFLDAYRRSSHPERTADVTLQLAEHYLVRSSTSQTSHGSPYWYDTHVPLIIAGPGIRAGRHTERVRTVDIAPTLARALGIAPPADLDGRTLPGF